MLRFVCHEPGDWQGHIAFVRRPLRPRPQLQRQAARGPHASGCLLSLVDRHILRLLTSQNGQTLQSVLQLWKETRPISAGERQVCFHTPGRTRLEAFGQLRGFAGPTVHCCVKRSLSPLPTPDTGHAASSREGRRGVLESHGLEPVRGDFWP